MGPDVIENPLRPRVIEKKLPDVLVDETGARPPLTARDAGTLARWGRLAAFQDDLLAFVDGGTVE